MENLSDSMDMYNLVLRKFKQLHYQQEQDRHFLIYDLETLENSKVHKIVSSVKIFFSGIRHFINFISSCDICIILKFKKIISYRKKVKKSIWFLKRKVTGSHSFK